MVQGVASGAAVVVGVVAGLVVLGSTVVGFFQDRRRPGDVDQRAERRRDRRQRSYRHLVQRVDRGDLLAPGCVPAAYLVAASEVGRLGFERQDLGIIDVRGPTDSEVAHNVADSSKSQVGASEKWWDAGTFTGRYLERRDPVAILAVGDTTQPTILGGRYQLVRSERFGAGQPIQVSLYVRSGASVSCPGDGVVARRVAGTRAGSHVAALTDARHPSDRRR